MIIDAHNHPDWHGKDMDQILADMDAHGIDQAWMLTWECPEDEYDPDQRNLQNVDCYGSNFPVPFSRCLAYHRAHPDRFVLGFAPDPRCPESQDRLEAAINQHGVRVYGELKARMMYDNPDAIRMFRFCGEKKLPVILHIEYPIPLNQKYPRPHWWYGGGMEPVERVLVQCPETTFLGHALGFWACISDDGQHLTDFYPKGKVVGEGKLIRMLRQYPNLWCDISANSGRNALARDPEFTRGFLTEFQDRVVFARDMFGGAHQELLESLDLPREVLDKIYYQNAKRLLGE